MRRRLLAFALIAAAGVAAWVLRRHGVFGGDPWDPLTLRTWVRGAGIWGPALYVLVATLMPLFAPYPLGLTWVAGVLFGWGLGGCLVALSGLGSSLVGYGAGRFLGGSLWNSKRLQAAKSRLSEDRGAGWSTVALLRVLMPWDLVSYWAGGRCLPLRPYLAGTLLALLPVSFGYAYVASAFAEGEGRRVAVAIPVSLAVLFGPVWLLDRRRARSRG